MPLKKVDAATIDRLHIADLKKQISCQADVTSPKTISGGEESTF
jgi:hypothetical protein